MSGEAAGVVEVGVAAELVVRDRVDAAIVELWETGRTRFAGLVVEVVDRDEWGPACGT